ncbi:UPF0669 protein C6orf120 homolog [Diabrotica virgifera virgifera]|uniref:UPF0669 protein C6orf120 homolog n=1 Tax=Diabrotica virgifera virgifera TaxID=50390 RepID=A0A6P7GQ65_DIAVI|nr:UPF0669 protein C6orf120 homolog [Diabrotica virgifera virgifera]
MIHLIFKLLSLLIFSRADLEDGTNAYSNSEVLGYTEGVVGNESFVYYYIHHSGNIVLSLSSSVGDADMYISDTQVFPTYYPDTYDLHSATCGTDNVEIPLNFKSPIAVGVYGHSAHEVSNFILQVLKNPEADRAFAIIEDELPQEMKDSIQVPNEIKFKNVKQKIKKKHHQSAQRPSGFESLFEIIGLIFL